MTMYVGLTADLWRSQSLKVTSDVQAELTIKGLNLLSSDSAFWKKKKTFVKMNGWKDVLVVSFNVVDFNNTLQSYIWRDVKFNQKGWE